MIGKIFWEQPLTASVCVFLTFSYFLIFFFVPADVINTWFLSYPGNMNPVPMFLSTIFHGSPIHLFSNIAFLFVLGRAVEKKIGPSKWILYYVMAGFFSTFLDSFIRGFILDDKVPVVGASGAIAGIAGAAALLTPFSIPILGKNIPFPVFLISWFMVYSDFANLFSEDRVAHWAHLAGFLSVVITGYILGKEERKKLQLGFLLNLGFFTLTLILLFFINNR